MGREFVFSMSLKLGKCVRTFGIFDKVCTHVTLALLLIAVLNCFSVISGWSKYLR